MNDHVHLKIPIQWLRCLGCWPTRYKNGLLRNYFFRVLFRFVLFVYVIFVITQFIELYNLIVMGDLDQMSALLSTNVLYTLGLVKLWVIKGKTVERLSVKIQHTEHGILTSNDENARRIFLEHATKNHFVNRVMIILASSCYVQFCLSPIFLELISPADAYFDIIDNATVYRPRPLPLISWFPFDRYKYYKTSFGWHLIAITAISPCIVACNNFFFGLSIFAVGQIKILHHHLRNFKTISADDSRLSADESVKQNLYASIVYHNAIIIFVGELSKAMRTFLMLDFIACSLDMAVIGFQAAVTPPSLQLLRIVTYLVTIMTQLFLFYWFGNEIILESLGIGNAIWESQWYMSSRDVKQILAITMMRSQRPLTISVGPFYYMSTQTMMTVLRAAYSYAAIMHHLYSQ